MAVWDAPSPSHPVTVSLLNGCTIRYLPWRTSSVSQRGDRLRPLRATAIRESPRVLHSRPSNAAPVPAALRQSARSTPVEMAGALRRLHQSGVRRAFILVAPTRLARQPLIDLPEAEDASRQVKWWLGLCDLIRTQTALSVVLVGAVHRGLDTELVRERARLRKRLSLLEDLTRAERTALVEISRGVCTGDWGLLTEARVLKTPNYEPWEAQMAILDEAVGDLFASTASGALPASA